MMRTSLSLLVSLIFSLQIVAQEEQTTEITSDTLFFDYEGKQAIFTGNVLVNDPNLQLTGDKLTVFLTAEDELKSLVAVGNVEIKMEGMQSRSGKAEYTLSDGKMVLTDNPQVSRENSVLQAEKLTYWHFEGRLEAYPDVRFRSIQHPREKPASVLPPTHFLQTP